MTGFFNEIKREQATKPKRRNGPIPIAALNQLGCQVCPRDKAKLYTPKWEPEGDVSPMIYLLSNRPTMAEDEKGRMWSGPAGREILSKLESKSGVRMGHVLQCAPDSDEGFKHLPANEVECCRSRTVGDIERSRPLVVVGVGDEALHWATGLQRNANMYRGTMIATRIGNHVCWYFPILYPNYTNQEKRWRVSEYELTLKHDLAYIEDLAFSGDLKPAEVFDKPYDGGLELITGEEPGDMQRLEEAFHWLLTLRHQAMDIETNGIRVFNTPDPKIWSAAHGTFDRTIAFSIEHPEGWGSEGRIQKVKLMYGEFLMQSQVKICHNLAFEQEWTSFHFGEHVLRRTEWADTMAQAHTLDERKGIKNLDTQCRIHFGFFLKAQSRVDVGQPNWINLYTPKETLRYNGLDTKWTFKLHERLTDRLSHMKVEREVYESRVRLAPTLVLTSSRGFPVDFKYAENMVDDIEAKIKVLEDRGRRTEEIKKFTARFGTFSFTNSDHVLQLMRDICGRDEVFKETWEGDSETTDEDALSSIPANEVPSAPIILEHRTLTRCVSTYLLPLVEGKMGGADGKIHEEYSSLHTATGRLSSKIHNWPKHKHKEVRGAIAAPENQWLVAADQGQIEFRVCGMLSEDDNLIKYCWTGYDVHMFWAKTIYGAYPEITDWIVKEFEVDWDEKGLKTLRQVCKNNWVFPLLFGSKTKSCAGRMHIPEDIADELGAQFWDEFPGVKRWQERVLKDYARNLYVETMGGIRRRGPTRENQLINMPIQGTACEIVLAGMNALSERSDLEGNPNIQPAYNGHDDLTFVVHDDCLESSIEIITHEMCMPRFDYVNVPLIVEVAVGPRWHELEEIGKFSSEKLFNLRNPFK